jgi:aryl-alcohol dehydrogenase-like predicted oxidoreductase
MEYRFLGHTGVKVSELCLGAMTFGRETPEAESYQLLDHFAAAGGNFIDTANIYGQGASETIAGKWLKRQKRQDWIVASKVRFPMGDGPNQVGLSRKHILDSVEASLARLQTDYLDLYQVHAWDSATPLEETLSTLHSLVQAGKVRYVGASNFTAWQLQKAVDLSRAHGWEPFICLQPLYNLLDRDFEWELAPVCLNEGIGVIPWSPLRGGWLTGKYTRDMQAPMQGTRIDDATRLGWGEAWDKYNTTRTWAVLDALRAVAARHARQPAQAALRWLLQQPAVTAPIIGARTLAQLDSNLGAAGWHLEADDLQILASVSEKEPPYPMNFLDAPRS